MSGARLLQLTRRVWWLVFLLCVVAHAGVLIGLAVASLLNIVAMIAVGILAGITPPFGLHSSAWAVGISMGLIMPTIANVVPIRRALSSVLRDSLDLYHQVSVCGQAVVCVAHVTQGDTTFVLTDVFRGHCAHAEAC